MTKTYEPKRLSRRDALRFAGVGALAAGSAVFSGKAFATPAEAEDFLKKASGASSFETAKVTIDAPAIAENGNTVPLEISVDAPMTEQEYVQSIHIAADGNPTPQVATFKLSPASGKAFIKFRTRLAKTQTVRAVAVMNNGKAYVGEKEIKVTIGGCGG